MLKPVFVTLAVLLALDSPALAASESWLVTEENTAGVKGSQGTWMVTIDGNKLSGTAELQTDTGRQLTYKLQGNKSDGIYTVTLSDRSDGKKGCVWSGHAPAGTGTQTHGLVGYVECEGVKLIIRASIVGH